MRDRAHRIAKAAAGSVDPERLIDRTLLRNKPVFEYLQADEELQYLFVNEETGVKIGRLSNPDTPDDFSVDDIIEKEPGKYYGAVMMVTSARIHYIVGGFNEHNWFKLDLTEITAVRSEAVDDKPAIAVRNAEKKFMFVPTSPDEIESAIEYLMISVKDVASTGKQSSMDQESTDKEEPQDKSSEKRTASASFSSRRIDDDHSSGDMKAGVSARRTKHSKNELVSAGTTESKNKADSQPERSATDNSTEVTESGPQTNTTNPTDAETAELPAAVTSHFVAGQKAFEWSQSPFTEPDESYATMVSAYHELCQALEALPADEHPAKHEQIESQIDELETLIESLAEYRPVLKQARTLTDTADRNTADSASTPDIEAVYERLEALQTTIAETSINSGPIEALLTELEHETGQPESATPGKKSVSTEEGNTQTGYSGATEEEGSSGSNKKSRPKTADSSKESERTVEERFNAATESTAAAAAADTTSTVVLRLQRCFCDTDEKVVYNAVDPSDDQIWLVIRGHPEKKFASGQCYRFAEIDVSPAFGEESYRVHVSASSTIEQLPEGTDGESSIRTMRIERAADQLFTTDQADFSAEMQKQVKETSKKIHEFDLQNVDIQTGLDQLNAIRSNLNVIDIDSAGVDSARLDNVTTRVARQAMKLDKLKQVLITAQRNITLANESGTIPVQDLQEADKELQTAISIAQELGRDATQFKSLRGDIEGFLEDIPDPEPAPVSDPDPNAPIDDESGIQANEISEYYESLWNLKQLTATVQTVVDDIDEPMQQWCDFVKAFLVGETDEYPNYGKLQADFNEFAISAYRDVYGDGERTTEFHVIDVEPLTATVQQLVENSSQLLATDLDLPVAPESGIRLPVIVETKSELDRATALLKEFPKSPSKAVLPETKQGYSDDQETEENGDKDNSGDKTSGEESSDGDADDGSPDRRPDDEAPLTEIGGVTEDVANVLRNADITTREQLTEMDLSALAEIDGISNAIAQRIKMQVG